MGSDGFQVGSKLRACFAPQCEIGLQRVKQLVDLDTLLLGSDEDYAFGPVGSYFI